MRGTNGLMYNTDTTDRSMEMEPFHVISIFVKKFNFLKGYDR